MRYQADSKDILRPHVEGMAKLGWQNLRIDGKFILERHHYYQMDILILS